MVRRSAPTDGRTVCRRYSHWSSPSVEKAGSSLAENESPKWCPGYPARARRSPLTFCPRQSTALSSLGGMQRDNRKSRALHVLFIVEVADDEIALVKCPEVFDATVDRMD